jgi:MFS family permease
MNHSATQDHSAKTPLAVAALALSMMLASLGTSIANIALPTLSSDLAIPFYRVQWVVTAYLVALTLSVVVVGRLGDRFGLKKMLLFGLGLFALASCLCGLAPSLRALVAARALQGVGAAFLMTLAIALVHEAAPENRIGRAMGLLGTMSALGTALGPSLGGVLISVTGWQGIFLALVPFSALCFALVYRVLPDSGRAPAPAALRMSALLRPGLLPRLVANLCVAATMMATLVVGPFYLGFALGLGTAATGIVMTVGPVISIASGVPSGRLVDAWGAPRVILAGLGALVSGAVALVLLPMVWGLWGYLVAIAILTPGYQLFQAANNTAIMADVAQAERGVVSGLLGLFRNLGLVAGASGLGAVFALGAGTDVLESAAPSAIVDGMQMTFLLAAALMAGATCLVRARAGDDATA